MKLLINRINEGEKQSIGQIAVIHDSKVLGAFPTLELPDKDNASNISNIPPGFYDVVMRNSTKHGRHYHITGVPGRKYVLIHSGNYYTQIRGCVLPGSYLSDINGDGLIDTVSSGDAMRKLLKLTDGYDCIQLEITES